MSGGSWDYVYSKFGEVADQLEGSKNPLRRAFGKHMRLVATAMHDIEWVDSGDCGPGDENAAIEAVLGKDAKALCLIEIREEARAVLSKLEAALKEKP